MGGKTLGVRRLRRLKDRPFVKKRTSVLICILGRFNVEPWRMNELTLIVRDAPVAAFLLRVTPVGEGRSIYRVSVPTRLNKGESCHLRDSAGRQLECFVVDSEAQGSSFWVDLKCLDDPQFEGVDKPIFEEPPGS
jgi:hypothetical protein